MSQDELLAVITLAASVIIGVGANGDANSDKRLGVKVYRQPYCSSSSRPGGMQLNDSNSVKI